MKNPAFLLALFASAALGSSIITPGGSGSAPCSAFASQAQAEAGSDATNCMNALRTAQAIAAQAAPISIPFTLGITDFSGTGTKACAVTQNAVNITGAYLIADDLPTSAHLVFDVHLANFDDYTGPASASSITASATPTIQTGDTNPRYSDTTLTGWTTAIPANSVLCAVLDTTPATVTWATLVLTTEP